MKKGQTLVSLLFFTVIAMTITTTAFILLLNSLQSLTKHSEASLALNIAESGAENALLRLVRNPFYTGETLAVDEGQAEIEVVAGEPIKISSVGKIRNTLKKIELQIRYNVGVLEVISWKQLD
jgi:hypothetical protein